MGPGLAAGEGHVLFGSGYCNNNKVKVIKCIIEKGKITLVICVLWTRKLRL